MSYEFLDYLFKIGYKLILGTEIDVGDLISDDIKSLNRLDVVLLNGKIIWSSP